MAEVQTRGGWGRWRPRERGWRLLVLEDTGELLTPDAKTVIGQGLSRFLNVVDGLIGQGLRVLVLVTTTRRSASSILPSRDPALRRERRLLPALAG